MERKDFEVKPYAIFVCIDRFLMKYEIKIKAIAALSLGQEDVPMMQQASGSPDSRIE